MNVQIYTLSHPETGEIRYVGRTIRKLSSRLKQHIYDSKKHSHHNSNWIKGLSKKKLVPKIELLDMCDEKSWSYTEQYWISQLKAWGFRLTNDNIGGIGNLQPTNETRKKIGKTFEKPILQYSISGYFIREFKSIKEASEICNIHNTQITRSLRKNLISPNTFVWKYKTSEKYPQKIEVNFNKKNKSVSKYDLNGVFICNYINTKEAALSTNTNRTSIIECCN